MSLIRAILNNGFFFIVLIVAAAVYLAYSDNIKRDHGLLPEQEESQSTNTVAKHNSEPQDLNTNVTETAIEKETQPSSEAPNQPKQPVQAAIKTEQEVNTSPEEETSTETQTPSQKPNLAKINSENSQAVKVEEKANTDANKELQNIDPKTPALASTFSGEEAIKTQSKNDLGNESENKSGNKSENESNKDSNTTTNTEETAPTDEVNKTLDNQTAEQQNSDFKTEQDALKAAKDASAKSDFKTAAKIYSEVAKKHPSANVVGQLAQALYQDGKKEEAAKAWLESAKLLVAEKRFPEAMILSARLAPFAPAESREIQQNLQKMQMAYINQKRQAMQAKMLQYRKNMQNKMANNKTSKSMPTMQPMPQYKPAPMKPMPPMQ
ncbi:hypothetical protein, partial [Thiomicrorhabdus sp. Milos-T2]|uniref:hypothetical protein n=1 Tax=Thiomicrorhabdus sp. Milos-T2 TaxID=90814 RepID=UPI000494A6DA